MRHSPRGYSRTERIADQIQRDLALLLQREIKDPRLGMVTISAVKVSKDLAYADIYVTIMGRDGELEAKEGLDVLARASGFLRSTLAKMNSLRTMPRLRFHYDQTVVDGPRMQSLISKAIKEDQAHHSNDPLDGEE